jgi:dTDP-L-rhamnose 4-epimerase
MIEKSKKILITGGLGFIGTEVIARSAPTDEILIVDNLHPQVHGDDFAVNRLPSHAKFLRGDVTDPTVMAVAAQFHPTVVLHLAAETGTGQSLRESRRHANVNVNGTATLLDALSGEDWRPERFVLTSSRAVYGEGKWASADGSRVEYASARNGIQLDARQWNPVGVGGAELDTPIANEMSQVEARPSNVYAATKLAQENIAYAWCNSFDVPLTILRLQNVYGAGQAIGNPYTGVLTFMAGQAASGARMNVFEGGGIVRDFVNIVDVASAIVSALNTPHRRDIRADIGSGTPATLLEVATMLADLANAPTPVTTDDFRLGDVRAAFADITAAERELSFVPSKSMRDGLSELLKWIESGVTR